MDLTGIHRLRSLADQKMRLALRPRTCQGVKMSDTAQPSADKAQQIQPKSCRRKLCNL